MSFLRTTWAGAIVAMVVAVVSPAHAAQPLPGESADWEGWARHTFTAGEMDAWAIVPEQAAEGMPWVWQLSDEPTALDRALLRCGFHIVHVDPSDIFGSPAAVKDADALYSAMTEQHGLAAKAAIECEGPNALLAFAWAAANPKKVACLFAVDPVLDFASWPAGKGGKMEADPEAWAALQKAFTFASEDEALAYEGLPLRQAKTYAEARFPLMHVCRVAETAAAYSENTGKFVREYGHAGGTDLYLIEKRNHGRPAGLEDSAAGVYFMLKNALYDGREMPAPDNKALGVWEPAVFDGTGPILADAGVIYLGFGNDMTGVKWRGEPPCRMNYEVSLEAMRVEGRDFFCGLTVPYGDTVCSLVVGGWGGTCVGISSIDYNDAFNNETARFLEFESGKWYKIRLRSTPGRIEAWIDDEQIVDVETEGRNIDIRYEMNATVPLGIATWRTTGAFRNFMMKPLPGN